MEPKVFLPKSSLSQANTPTGVLRCDLPLQLIEKLDLTQLLKAYKSDILKDNLKPLAEAIQQKIEQELGENYVLTQTSNMSPPYTIEEIKEKISEPFFML